MLKHREISYCCTKVAHTRGNDKTAAGTLRKIIPRKAWRGFKNQFYCAFHYAANHAFYIFANVIRVSRYVIPQAKIILISASFFDLFILFCIFSG